MTDLQNLAESVPFTPALIIDGEVAARNIQRLAAYAAAHRLNVRPHTKTHKSVRVARMQLAAGAVGLTVAKAGEAEVMARAGERPEGDPPSSGGLDLLLAYPAVDPVRCRRVAALAGEHTVRVALDSVVAARALSAAAASAGVTVGVLVDLDVGMGRTGVQSPADALTLAEAVNAMTGLRVDGLFCYPGHVWAAADEQGSSLVRVSERLAEAIDLFERQGMDTGIVSGGSTPTAYQSHLIPQITEIRPGTYVYNDMNTVRGGFGMIEDCAAAVVCTVVSTAVPGRCVIDAGSKTLGSDRCVPDPHPGHGHIIEYPQAKIVALSEEHGHVDVSNCDDSPDVGERVTVIPNHICPCINLHDTAWWYENGGLEPLPIDARGKVA